jgi:mannose-6-phosphate isomerase-like protein (cupin superfamily)
MTVGLDGQPNQMNRVSSLPEVGTKKLYEDDRIIYWGFILEPGEKTPLHTHKYEYVWYVLDGSTLEVFDKDDKSLGTFESPTGAVFPLRLEGDDLV